jgi:serine protease Do
LKGSERTGVPSLQACAGDVYEQVGETFVMSYAGSATHRLEAKGWRCGRLWPISLAFTVLLSAGAAPLVRAQDTLSAIASDVQKVYEHAKGAVVRVQAEDEHGRLSGTGFLVDPNGTIYTSYDVGGESKNITVDFGANRYPARRLVADIRSGIAILKVDATTPWLNIGKSDEVKTASPIVIIGYPLDLPATPNFGMVGGLDLKYLDRYFCTTLIRANIVAQRGEGGSPVLNLKGEAVGILISSIDNGGACYALPIKAAEKVRTDYLRFGEVRPGWLGVRVGNGDQAVKESTVVITGFSDDSPAAHAGLENGDVVLQVGTVKIRTAPDDLIDASFFLTAQEDVPVTVVRAGKELTVNVTASEHPMLQGQKTPPFPSFPASGVGLPTPGETPSPANND